IEFAEQLPAEIGESTVVVLVTTAAHGVRSVVGELHDAQPELPINLHHRQIITESAGVLPPEDNAYLAFPLAVADVSSGVNLANLFRVVPKPALPIGDRPHAGGKIFPHAGGAIGRGDATGAHCAKHLGAPVGDDQAVDDHRVIVQ